MPPSDALVGAAARALTVDADELHLLAGRVPPSWQQTIDQVPERAVEHLRGALASCVAEPTVPYGRAVIAFSGTRAIEDESFPFEELSDIAEVESWRKEIYRPVYHLHKWWAQRLGSVFRAILIGAFAPKGSNILEMFYQPTRLPRAIVFDPFMGSGTTLGEALKLGARAIGRDINPVAHFAVRNGLGIHDRRQVVETFEAIRADVAHVLRRYYQARLHHGSETEVLYYFWVKFISCPDCGKDVDLFSSFIFAQHAYPARNPLAQAVCPTCSAINTVRYDAAQAACARCKRRFAPRDANARGTKATCPSCTHAFPILKAVRAKGSHPEHRLYAKLVLHADGRKEYLPADDFDRRLYQAARGELQKRRSAYPVVPIEPGYNTDQVLNYGYTHWHQMFNARQLLCLSILAERIRAIEDESIRMLFTCLFSGCLEFNNMFASYKGEGTGAVRHMFSHHILKPERMPIEANLWGTPRSSGAFSTLFESRLLRALQYRERPFEIRVHANGGRLAGEKVSGLSCPIGHDVAETFADFEAGAQLYLSCGDSAQTDVPSASVDAVITDPPFFDNVHYSQLADFFFVWQRHILGANGHHESGTTRSPFEVQQSDPGGFAERLTAVWKECARALRPDGLLIFTYHHSRPEGWEAVLRALVQGGFAVAAAHPIKAEMSVAAPKQQAREPIDLDIILVCRKRKLGSGSSPRARQILEEAEAVATRQLARLNAAGRRLSRNDVRVVVSAQVVSLLSRAGDLRGSLGVLRELTGAVEELLDRLQGHQRIGPRRQRPGDQLSLLQ